MHRGTSHLSPIHSPERSCKGWRSFPVSSHFQKRIKTRKESTAGVSGCRRKARAADWPSGRGVHTGQFHPTWGIGFVNEVAELPGGGIDVVRWTGQCLGGLLPLHPLWPIKALSSWRPGNGLSVHANQTHTHGHTDCKTPSKSDTRTDTQTHTEPHRSSCSHYSQGGGGRRGGRETEPWCLVRAVRQRELRLHQIP